MIATLTDTASPDASAFDDGSFDDSAFDGRERDVGRSVLGRSVGVPEGGRSGAGGSHVRRPAGGRSGGGRSGVGGPGGGRSRRLPGERSTEAALDAGSAGGPCTNLRSRSAPARSRKVPSPAVIHRRRLVAGGLAAAILLGLLVGLQALFGRPGGGPLASVGSPAAAQPAVARVWVVHPGDTLWSIALASGARGDIRPLVAQMSAEVGGRPLQPGERIRIP